MKKNIFIKSIVSIISMMLVITAYTGIIDTFGKNYTEKTLSRALIVFGIARGINGVISVAQGTELSFQPVGIGLNFTPGEILDPINDLVERFSLVMLASSTSIGIQKILLDICEWQFFTYTYIFFQLFFMVSIWLKMDFVKTNRKILSRIILVMIFIRFSIPVFAITNEWVFNHFLSSQFNESTMELQKTTNAIREINEQTENEVAINNDTFSITEQVKSLYNKTISTVDFKEKIRQYKAAAMNATKYTINLIVVFIFQTILFPVFYLFLLYSTLKWSVKNIPLAK